MRLLALRLVILLGLAGAAFAADPLVGTWKLNLAKSNYRPPQPKEEIVVVTEQGNNLLFSVRGVQPDGRSASLKYIEPKNGGPISWIEGGPPRDVLSVSKRIDDRTREETATKGEISLTARIVVSKDGKIMTITRKNVNHQVDRVELWDRQ